LDACGKEFCFKRRGKNPASRQGRHNWGERGNGFFTGLCFPTAKTPPPTRPEEFFFPFAGGASTRKLRPDRSGRGASARPGAPFAGGPSLGGGKDSPPLPRGNPEPDGGTGNGGKGVSVKLPKTWKKNPLARKKKKKKKRLSLTVGGNRGCFLGGGGEGRNKIGAGVGTGGGGGGEVVNVFKKTTKRENSLGGGPGRGGVGRAPGGPETLGGGTPPL